MRNARELICCSACAHGRGCPPYMSSSYLVGHRAMGTLLRVEVRLTSAGSALHYLRAFRFDLGFGFGFGFSTAAMAGAVAGFESNTPALVSTTCSMCVKA